ncbi:MAG: FlgO family outer membrane protein [candidate division Zixibacteria bacterium]|nr:FlgO family outer membrane protein [candidate division Zixibacteria bacterium]
MMPGGCDKHFEDNLYAYELGLLDDDERRELELHLLECEHCLDNARRFQRTIKLIRRDPDVRRVVERMAAGSAQAAPRQRPLPLLQRMWRTALVPTTVAAVILMLVLVLKDWQFEIRPSQPATAAENRLAIMDFGNITNGNDPEKLGMIVANLLVTDLSESHYLQMVSSRRLTDEIRLMQIEADRVIDEDYAGAVGRRLGARWVLTGDILRTKSEFILTSQLTEVATGRVIASQRVVGDVGGDLFSLVDNLSAAVMLDLGLPPDARHEIDRGVADATTHSVKAYYYYLEGLDYEDKQFEREAIRSYEQALEYDSTFAIAYLRLNSLGRTDKLALAVKYIDRASDKDKFWIRSAQAYRSGDMVRARKELRDLLQSYPDSKEAYFALGFIDHAEGNFDEAVVLLRQALAIDPLYKQGYNQLAYTYCYMYDIDNALKAIDKGVALAPDEPNPYDSRGEICAFHGRIDEAIESYRKALEVRPDFTVSQLRLAELLVSKGEYEEARSLFQDLAGREDRSVRRAGWNGLAAVETYQGKFQNALKVLNDAMVADRLETGRPRSVVFPYLKAVIYVQLGEIDRALEAIDIVEQIARDEEVFDTQYTQQYLAQLLAECREIERAEEKVAAMRASLEGKKSAPAYWVRYWYGVGAIQQARGNREGAVAAFEKAAYRSAVYTAHMMLARAYQEAGRFDEALIEYEKVMAYHGGPRVFWGVWAVKTHYYLGMTYEDLGRYDEARQQYETFLDIWKHADDGIEEIADAQKRLVRLKSRS